MSVYVIQRENGDVKIGYTAGDISVRLYKMKNQLKCQLNVLRVTPGDMRMEKAFHRHFSDHALGGEWFRFQPDMLDVTLDPLPPALVRKPTRKNKIPSDVRLKVAVINANIKNNDIAKSLGVTASSVSKWITCKYPVPHQHMAKFAAMIGVTVEDLLPCSECESGCSGKQEAAM